MAIAATVVATTRARGGRAAELFLSRRVTIEFLNLTILKVLSGYQDYEAKLFLVGGSWIVPGQIERRERFGAIL